MAQITAAAVKALREKTGLPMMDCKNALTESDGDESRAIDWLRKRGGQIQDKRSDRETAFGRMGIYTSLEQGVGAMVELKCESAPVTSNAEFIQLANDLAESLAGNPDVSNAEQLLALASPSKSGITLAEQKDDLFNRIREVFNVGRMVRISGPCGAYSHNASTVSGVLVEISGKATAEAVKDVCMHVAAMRPSALNVEDLDQAEVAKEREILLETTSKEGKPENIVEKIVEGRMRNFYAQHVLVEQPFVKDDKISVGKFAEQNGFKIVQFVHWVLGEV